MDMNPLTTEIIEIGKELLSADQMEATKERMGGTEVVDQLVLSMRNSCVLQHPEIALLGVSGLAAIEVALFSGMALGVAAEQRARKGDELLREWGVE